MSTRKPAVAYASISIDLAEAKQLDWQEYAALAHIECEKAYIQLMNQAPMPIQADEINGMHFPAYSTIGSDLRVQAELGELGFEVTRDAPTKSGHWLAEVVQAAGKTVKPGEIVAPEGAVGYCSAQAWGALRERLLEA